MSPALVAILRRHWPVFGALTLFLVFAITQASVFGPMAGRYDAVLKRSHALGIGVDPEETTPTLPPRVFALLTDHALPAAEAQDRAASGALTAGLLEDLNQIASERGLAVLATEPGPVSQDPQSVRVRAHLKMRGNYAAYVAWLSEIAQSRSLTAVDRFSLQSGDYGAMQIDLWVSRYVVKQSGSTR